ncbi:hypothetical protein HD553DRAFT_347322 [Filobasidium floriforme]|uniref:uncharacterized protein n=1 Tax=Filobasidium floriforme TaxID=5210 RepID=UPI001E8D236A|nr:uncharacterized protein HD553DRAFT_347322 [Filobasidium floriforme]KAH8090864.1 hypothetical protein HD553DRAFT_347322 [Filobasidium floriforme]
MLFKSKNVRATLTGLSSKEGLLLDIPSNGRLVACSGDTIRGVVQLEDPGKIESLSIEFAGYQYVSVEAMSTGYNTTGFNTVTALGGVDAQVGAARASAKPVNHRVATKLFSTVQHITKAEAGSAGGVVNFDFVFPDQDERGTRMPPSLQLESTRFAGGSVGYCRYQVTVLVERKSMGRTKSESIILPILYMPFSLSSSPPSLAPISTLLARTNPNEVADVPEKWKSEIVKDAWEVTASGGIGGLFKKKSRGDEATEGVVRIQFATPNLDLWPPSRPIPYHLLLTFTSRTPSSIDLTRSEISFDLKQRIQTNKRSAGVAKAFEEVIEPSRSSAMGSGSGTGVTVGPKGFGFELTKDGIWSGTEEDGDGWSKVMVQMGTVQINGLPTIFTDVTSLVYQLRMTINLPSDSAFADKKKTFVLDQPILSSPIYEGHPGLPSDEDQSLERRKLLEQMLKMVGKDYWEDEEDFGWFRGDPVGGLGMAGDSYKKLAIDTT